MFLNKIIKHEIGGSISNNEQKCLNDFIADPKSFIEIAAQTGNEQVSTLMQQLGELAVQVQAGDETAWETLLQYFQEDGIKNIIVTIGSQLNNVASNKSGGKLGYVNCLNSFKNGGSVDCGCHSKYLQLGGVADKYINENGAVSSPAVLNRIGARYIQPKPVNFWEKYKYNNAMDPNSKVYWRKLLENIIIGGDEQEIIPDAENNGAPLSISTGKKKLYNYNPFTGQLGRGINYILNRK